MKLKTTLMAAAVAAGLALTAAPANAYIFGFSHEGNNGTTVTLTLDGLTDISSFDTGWYDADGTHNPGNTNYIVDGDFDAGRNINNWFAFDLSSLMGTFTTASLRLNSYTASETASYHVYDFGGNVNTLTAGMGGVSAFNDLGSGTNYGVFSYSPANNNQVRTLTLNAAAVTGINQAVGSRFVLGGMLESQAAVVPEPATWAMMLLGFFGLGSALRARRRVAVVAQDA